MAQLSQHYATGRRKSAIARVWIKPGSGRVIVNDQAADDYFKGLFFEPRMARPFSLTETQEKYDVWATLSGGGKSAQMDALVHGISRALQTAVPEFRSPLKKAGLLTRDARAKERKKYGQRGARARFQYSKR
ncbi:MAG: 30S ribosomal protein S9 [Desulfobulbaceae bacterium A2]|nr:MAG: 30S ribosomal protein S9 [Desulfobulbaceae bacterium A2]